MIPSTENLIAVANIWLSRKQLKASRVLQWKLSNSFINRQAWTHCCWYIHRPFFLWGARVFFFVPKVEFYSKLMQFNETISAVIAGFLLYKKGMRNCHNTATAPLIPNVKLMFMSPSEFKAANKLIKVFTMNKSKNELGFAKGTASVIALVEKVAA